MPIFHDIEQGSPQWISFRKERITATDISVICKVNPFKSPYMLWMEKLGLKDPEIENEAMREGKRLEPIALDKLNSELGYKCVPVVVTHSDYPLFMASIDGWDGRAVEIKCGKKSLQQSREMFVPLYYEYQMQWQMYVLEITSILYYCFDGVNYNFFKVNRDQELIDKMIVKANEFLDMLRTLTPPPFTDLDYEDKSHDDYWNSLCESYAHADNQEKQGKATKESIKKQLIEYSQGRNVKGSWSKFTKYSTKGRVDYDKLTQDLLISQETLDSYRSKPIESFRLTISKD